MRMRRVFIGGILLGLLACLPGCKDEDMAVFPEDGQDKPTHALFQLDIAFDAGSRGRALPDDHTPGHAWERKLSKLFLFAVPVERQSDKVEEDWTRVSWAGVAVPDNPTFPLTVPLELRGSGEMNFYVGANLSTEQAQAFIRSREYAVKGQKYYEAINEFAPFSSDPTVRRPTVRRPTDDIALFCCETKSLNIQPSEKASEEETPTYHLGTMNLKSLVAKVLVACHTIYYPSIEGEAGVAYVPLARSLAPGEDPQGWIRQSDVYYFVNNMSRRTRFMHHYSTGENKIVLPNYNLKEVMSGLVTTFVPLGFNMTKVDQHFIHYDMLELYRRNKSFQPTSVWDQGAYDDLVSSEVSADNPYNQTGIGMYTLENLFDLKTEGTSEEAFTEEELAQLWAFNALPVITHVSIAAKFTPRYLYAMGEEWDKMKNKVVDDKPLADQVDDLSKDYLPAGSKYRYLRCKNEAVSHAILTASLQLRNVWNDADYSPDNKDQYPSDTFFAYHVGQDSNPNGNGESSDEEGEIAFCTYGVATSFGDLNEVDASMVPYTRGWGYYYTYINNNENAPITSAEQLKNASVERNNYYLLHVKSIGSMGSTIADPNYMKVYTLKATWQDGGTGNIKLN